MSHRIKTGLKAARRARRDQTEPGCGRAHQPEQAGLSPAVLEPLHRQVCVCEEFLDCMRRVDLGLKKNPKKQKQNQKLEVGSEIKRLMSHQPRIAVGQQ